MLTLGIGLGCYWAYYELGWGGWWFWDPVENVSLMPWIAGLALVHSLFISKGEQVLTKWIVFLSILCFSLSIFGTFLVRSGILTSVHSFASDPSRGLFILLINNVFNQEIGGECTLENGEIGFYDCELCCWDNSLLSWLGDGYCDYLGGCGWEGPLFDCPELGYDCGDCIDDWNGSDQSGLCSNDCTINGDLNNDEILNILDVVAMINLILDSQFNACGDINLDNALNILDVVMFVNIILSIP